MRPELETFVEEIAHLRPPGLAIDIHTHLGVDEDGRTMSAERLLAQLDAAGIARAATFPLHDPDRRPAYRRPNDLVIEAAASSGGRLTAFCRLDPQDGAVAEAERCLARGARGIKLHPRAHTGGFDDGSIEAVFAVAAEAAVPVLIHAGRGLPAIVDDVCDVALRHPGAPLVLAHAGIAAQSRFTHRLADHPAAFFDTAVTSPVDLLALFARVPPERIVFGTDPPYGRPLLGLYLTLRCARAARLNAEALASIMGGAAFRLLDGGALAPCSGHTRRSSITQPDRVARVANLATLAFGALQASRNDVALGHLQMASACCADDDGSAADVSLARLAPVFDIAAERCADPGSRVPIDAVYLAMVMAATEVD